MGPSGGMGAASARGGVAGPQPGWGPGPASCGQCGLCLAGPGHQGRSRSPRGRAGSPAGGVGVPRTPGLPPTTGRGSQARG